MNYFLPALYGVAPNAEGFSVVRPYGPKKHNHCGTVGMGHRDSVKEKMGPFSILVRQKHGNPYKVISVCKMNMDAGSYL